MKDFFACGHPCTPDNTRGRRCRTCEQEYDRRRAQARRMGEMSYIQDKNISRYDEIGEGILGRDRSMETLPAACASLHKALYREHPEIFHKAFEAGDYVVFP